MDFVGTITREIFSISWYWWIVIFVPIVVAWRGRREKFVDALVLGYIVFIFVITVFNRPIAVRRAEWIPFWSYSIPRLRGEIVLNYILFVPLGLLTAIKNTEWKQTWMMGTMLSVCVEILQYVFRRGLFEFDDIIGNSIGYLLSIFIVIAIKTIWTNDKQH